MRDRDLVVEARALLMKTAPKGKITNGADAYLFDMRGPELLSSLCDEVERQVRIADSLERHIESQDRQISDLQRSNIEAHEAIRAAIEYVNSVGRDLPHALGCEQQLVEQLETVITPKGTSNGE